MSQQAEHKEPHNSVGIATNTTEEKEENQLICYYEKLVCNRRNAKALYKLHEEVIDCYRHTIWPVKVKTIRKYARIVTQFIIFSQTLDPNDVSEFLKLKFSQENLISAQSKVKVAPWVNILHIKRFLLILYRGKLNEYQHIFS